MIEAIEKIDGVKRARICYLYPTTVSEKLVNKIAESSVFAPYFDMPIQHASSPMLKAMKRGMNAEKTFELINKMREKNSSYIRTAFIIGHPQETEEDFSAICDAIDSEIFDRVSLFAFSDEEKTAANKMIGKIDPKTAQKRLKIAQKLVKRLHKKKLKNMIGKTLTVAIDGLSDETDLLIAAKNLDWSPEIDPPILINESEVEGLKAGAVGKAQIIAATDDSLIAKFLG